MSDIIYYNVSINAGGTGASYSNASIVAQNSLPILEKPSDYYGSIVRLNVPQYDIPLAYFDVLVDNSGVVSDINKGIINFTLEYGTNSVTKYVYWIQQDFTVQPPPANTPKPVPSKYYFIYDYETYIKCWNTALSQAYDALQTIVGAPLTANTPPFFYYNPSTQYISLYSIQSFTEPNGGNYLKIYANQQISPYIKGFRYIAYDDPIKNILFNVESYPNQTYPLNNITVSGKVYIQIQQEYVSLNYWNMLQNIYITTTMPIALEGYYIGLPENVNSLGQNLLLQGTLTDYIPDLTLGQQAGTAGSQFIYNASSLWRLFQMLTDTPLYNISCSIYYTDINNNIWPLTLFTRQQANIKFMFIKKKLIGNFISARL